ncbi:MAG: hypothetical protein ACTSRI_07625 [Promethearchaeota archaeon]
MNQVIKFIIYFIIWYITGLLVLKKGVKVNYTRKINHFSLLFIPFLLDMILRPISPSDGSESMEGDLFFSAIGLLLGLIYFLFFIKPIRERVNVISTAFSSIDRPEDRPNTLLWISTQSVASFLVTIPFSSYLIMINRMELVFIVMIINGIGDGLAEPIGIRFGKHKYKTYALFSKKKYERSVEGSACVFIMGLLAIIIFGPSFSPNQFMVALITIPILMTLAEAFSPHSWDNPFLALVGLILLFLIITFL